MAFHFTSRYLKFKQIIVSRGIDDLMEIQSPKLKEIASNVSAITVEDFWEEISEFGSPLIEDINIQGKKLITFLYKEEEPLENVVVLLGPARIDYRRNKMHKIQATNIWFRSYLVHEEAKFQYLLSPNDPLTYPIDILPDFKKLAKREAGFIIDPLNKYPYPTNNPVVSTVGISDYDVKITNKSLKGTYEEFYIWSEQVNNKRKVGLYIPCGIDLEQEVKLLTFLDGELNPDYVPALNIIDTLIHSNQMKPIIVALVDNVDREKEMGCNRQFSNFLSDELTTYIEETKKLRLGRNNCICGFSMGGIGALYTGINRTEIYRNVLIASTSLYWSPRDYKESEYLIWYIAEKQTKPANIYIECGKMEDHSDLQHFFGGTSNLLSNRHLRNVLIAKAYKHRYFEYEGGHDFIHWRDSLERGLLYFYGNEI